MQKKILTEVHINYIHWELQLTKKGEPWTVEIRDFTLPFVDLLQDMDREDCQLFVSWPLTLIKEIIMLYLFVIQILSRYIKFSFARRLLECNIFVWLIMMCVQTCSYYVGRVFWWRILLFPGGIWNLIGVHLAEYFISSASMLQKKHCILYLFVAFLPFVFIGSFLPLLLFSYF